MPLARMIRPVAALVSALVAVALTHPAIAAPLAQAGSQSSDDRMKVIAITLAAVVAALLLTAIGYMYRRSLGITKPPPVTLLEPGRKITGD
jgi:hypothetical protein